MAVFLRDLYYDTKSLYKLNLLSGGAGMDNIVKWVYVSEDITTSAFLNGRELIITTGVTSKEQPGWLKAFIRELIKHNTSGLIVNTGKYIFEDDITDDIIRLCKKNNFPLITMPWETKIFNITHNYYNRIFDDTRTSDSLTLAFNGILSGEVPDKGTLDAIKEAGFSGGFNRIFCLRREDAAPFSDADETLISTFLHKELINTGAVYHIFRFNNNSVAVIHSDSNVDITGCCQEVISDLSVHNTPKIYAGLGSLCIGVNSLNSGYHHAETASLIAATQNRNFCSYDELGFIKLLLEIKDKQLIDSYIKDNLGKILDYDKEHHTALTDTLYEYLLCNGSIKVISEHLYCHRNTVNYRMRIIKEELGYNLDDTKTRFELMAAYQLHFLPYF